MERFRFWQRWLVAVTLFVIAFGLAMAVLVGTPAFAPFHNQIDPVFWSSGWIPESTVRFRTWMLSAWGATVAGWGVSLFFLARYPFRSRDPWAWKAIAWSVLLWFVLDTSVSLMYGVVFNAGFNLLLMILAGVPLLATRKAFARKGDDHSGHPA